MNIGNITSNGFNLNFNGKEMQIEVYEQLIEQLQQENKILKENAENNDKVVDKVNWENQLLKKENKQLKVTIDKAIEKLNSFIGCCKAEKLESGSDYLHHQYWNMFENFNKKIKDILKEGSK